MSNLNAVLTELNAAEKELKHKLHGIQQAKLALFGNGVGVAPVPDTAEPKPKRKYTFHNRKQKAVNKKHRTRAKCALCQRGYLKDRRSGKFCSRACMRIGYELRAQRNPTFRPGGINYVKYMGQAPLPTVILNANKKPKAVTLLPGDALSKAEQKIRFQQQELAKAKDRLVP